VSREFLRSCERTRSSMEGCSSLPAPTWQCLWRSNIQSCWRLGYFHIERGGFCVQRVPPTCHVGMCPHERSNVPSSTDLTSIASCRKWTRSSRIQWNLT
jgi:hypothetical protein